MFQPGPPGFPAGQAPEWLQQLPGTQQPQQTLPGVMPGVAMQGGGGFQAGAPMGFMPGMSAQPQPQPSSGGTPVVRVCAPREPCVCLFPTRSA
jgi:hypothetical protein